VFTWEWTPGKFIAKTIKFPKDRQATNSLGDRSGTAFGVNRAKHMFAHWAHMFSVWSVEDVVDGKIEDEQTGCARRSAHPLQRSHFRFESELIIHQFGIEPSIFRASQMHFVFDVCEHRHTFEPHAD
jgi:hypothetical protein